LGRNKTLREVALAAKVSPSTVSRAIAGGDGVSPEIQERIRNAALKLGIDLNEKIKLKIIAFILSNRGVLHPFHSRILAGAEAYCAEHGFDLLLVISFRYQSNMRWKELHLPQALQRRNLVRGVILAGTNSPNLLTLLAHKGVPFAVLGNNVIGEWEPKDYDAVWSDDVQGAYEITRYMHHMGHRDIWFAGNQQFPWFARCAAGYRRAMEEENLLPRFSEIRSDDAQEVGYLSTKSILSRSEPVSAIFAGSDETARGVYKALMEFGRRVPEDVSVAGMGDVEAEILRPRLTTVREFPEQLGQHLAEMVISRIGSPDIPPRQLTIPTEVVIHESCGPLRLTDRSREEILPLADPLNGQQE
jgi:DNA-binding LacI/PurR family transcriptional regulator